VPSHVSLIIIGLSPSEVRAAVLVRPPYAS